MTKVLIFFSLLSSSAFGMLIQDERGQIELALPEGWKYEKNLLGLPHVLLGPGDQNKVSLSVTMTGLEKVDLSSTELKKNQTQYQEGRKAWAEKRGIEIKAFIPYREFKIGATRVHEIGVEYFHEKRTQRELSYYVECPKTLVHMKGLGPKDSSEISRIKSIVESLRCL